MQFSPEPGIKSPEKWKTDWWSSHAGSLARFPPYILYGMVFRNEIIFLLSSSLFPRKHHLYIQQRLALLKRKWKACKRQEVFTTPWTEMSCQKNNQTWRIILKTSFSDGWDLFNFNDCVQFKPPQFSHRLQLLFDLLLWTLAKNGLIFTLGINSTWCSASHSRLMVGHYSYNAIDNIEQYWWQGKAG